MRLRNKLINTGSIVAVLTLLVLILSAPAAFADDKGSSLEPQHGIPLVIVNIDESEEGIAAAREKDPKHEYGTIKDMNSSGNHSVRCTGSVEIKVPEGYRLPEGDLSWVGKELSMDYIRGRGNSTWENVPKRPYKIQLNKKADLFGMGKSKDWALMANYFDKTLMHNRITYWLGAKLGMPYIMESIPVDVVMTGKDKKPLYLGCYDLSETVKVEESRVAIDKLSEKPDDTASAGGTDHQKTGGYLFSIFTSYQKDDPESNTFTTKLGVDFHFDNPEYMDESSMTSWQKEQRQYLRDYVQNVENLIIDCDEIDQAAHNRIDGLLDLKSVADYWLMQEFTINGDAFMTGSTYFFKPRGGKMFFGPLWDFDLAWGEMFEGEDDSDRTDGLNNTLMLWIDELRAKDPEFVRILEQEWAKLDPALTELTMSGGIIDQYRDEVRAAYNADPKLADREDADLDTDVERLRRWTDARHAWIGSNLDKFGAVYATVTYVADGRTIFVNKKAKIGQAADCDPEAPEKEGFYFTGWFAEDGSHMADVSIEKDTVFYAKYVDAEHAVLPAVLYMQDYEIWEEAGNTVHVGDDYTILPSGVVSDRLTWRSSDESIATADPSGTIYAHKAGDVILTAATVNGVEAEILLHVVEKGELDLKDPERIVFDEPEIKLEIGEHTQARWHFVPEGKPINKDVYMFDTSDDRVVDVDRLGVITAGGPGTARITMEVYYGDGKKLSATFKVTVTDPKTAKGTIHKKDGNTYKVLNESSVRKAGSVALIKAANRKSVKVPAAVTINNSKFSVTRIDAGAFSGGKIRTVTIGKNVKTIKQYAFRGSKTTKLIVMSKRLTKKSVKGSLKKSKVRKVKVKTGNKTVNKKYRNKYRKVFTGKNAGRTVKIY